MLWLICSDKWEGEPPGSKRDGDLCTVPKHQSFSKEGPQTIPQKPLRVKAPNAGSLASFEVSRLDLLGLGSGICIFLSATNDFPHAEYWKHC